MDRISLENIGHFYRRLNHSEYGCTEMRVLKQGNRNSFPIGSGFFDNEADFVAACVKYNGKGNLYTGRNPRPLRLMDRAPNRIKRLDAGQCGKNDDIEYITAVAIDIDPVRPDQKQPSTDGELSQAINAAKRLAGKYPGAWVDCTGNGACIWLSLNPVRIEGHLPEQLKIFEDEFRDTLTDEERLMVKVDFIYDLARINKVIGTLSVKGQDTTERPHRLTYFVDGLYNEPVKDLLQYILSLETPKPVKRTVPRNRIVTDQAPAEIDFPLDGVVADMPPAVRRLWEQGPPADRSLGLCTLLQYFLHKGFRTDLAVELVMQHADRRWGKFHSQGRPEGGREYLYSAALDIQNWADKNNYGIVGFPRRSLQKMFGSFNHA